MKLLPPKTRLAGQAVMWWTRMSSAARLLLAFISWLTGMYFVRPVLVPEVSAK
jgi:hypothetical protein